MYCEKYRCTMSAVSCYVRRKNAMSEGSKNIHKPGFSDNNCRDCEQGRIIAEQQDPEEAAKYSSDLKRIRRKALERATGNVRPVSTDKPSPSDRKQKNIQELTPSNSAIRSKKRKSTPTKAKPLKKINKRRRRVNVRRVEFGDRHQSLMDKIEACAAQNLRTFNGQVIFILYKYIEENSGSDFNKINSVNVFNSKNQNL